MNTPTLGKLEMLDLRTSAWKDEARNFTSWLAMPENLDQLAKALGLELELEGVEVSVGPYRADIFANDIILNTRVVIENQLEKTDHDHLGKIITYASGLEAKILIWIAREFTEEHRRAVDFLNECTGERMRFYAVEIQLFRIGNSPPAPYFNIVASPNKYAARVKEANITETKALYLEFWNSFKEYCKTSGTALSLRDAPSRNRFGFAVGRNKFSLFLTVSAMHQRLGCEIYMRGVNAKQAFKLLARDKNAIEAETGVLEWQELSEGQDCRVVRYRFDFDPYEKNMWFEGFRWLKTEAELFYKVFSPRIKALPIEDEEADIEEVNQL
ncbi:MAG TPA: DUF4268 domain-containing protein [Verrucomicrobiae bacterium]|nr:DUF4268 domain-containing protein [Verrucomicrobiae bacterium]